MALSISPAFLDELRSKLPLSEVVGRSVTFDRRKSNPRKRDYWACCPFHGEKTPSFHVEDEKGRYFCFGCGAKGDIVTFLMETQSLSFPEAVEALARDAGMEVPKATPEEARRVEVRDQLQACLEAAAVWFASRLKTPSGRDARTYLEGRDIDEGVIEHFRLGYAPGSGSALLEALAAQGFEADLLVRAGLSRVRERDGGHYDYFRDRLIFPITDRRGRVIGFGGRVLRPDVEPKYLNSPETEVFHKGRVLYNWARAREAARNAPVVLIVEGYMDAIACERAGLPAALAPLGTALTVDQLSEVWRLSPEPVLCFDGDGAGLRAAYKALDTALPALSPGRTVRFAMLPQGCDPDDLVRAEGPAALRDLVSRPVGVADLLWRREVEAGPLDTPERHAGLEARVREALACVSDANLRYHFEQDLRDRMRALRRPSGFWSGRPGHAIGRPGDGGRGRDPKGRRPFGPPPTATRELRASPLVRSPVQAEPGGIGGGARHSPGVAQEQGAASGEVAAARFLLEDQGRQASFRESEILAHVLHHPWLLEEDMERLAALDFADPDLAALRNGILMARELQDQDGEKALDSTGLKDHLSTGVMRPLLARVLENPTTKGLKALTTDAPVERVLTSWRSTMDWHDRIAARRRELKVALATFLENGTPEAQAWFLKVCRQCQEASRESEAVLVNPSSSV